MPNLILNLFASNHCIYHKNSQICTVKSNRTSMKKALALSMTLFICIKGFSFNDKIKIGLFLAPGISWMKPMGNEINNGVARFGMQYGLKVEYYFKDQNYAIATGLYGGLDENGLRGRDTLTKLNGGRSVLERYNANNIVLPCYLKLKTNRFRDKFRIFGELGFQLVFDVSARANYNSTIVTPSGQSVAIIKENVLHNNNEVQELIPGFRYIPFDFRLSAGGGVEYDIYEKTSLYFAIHYNNGFVPVLNDRSVNPKHDATVVRNLLFSIGAMF